MTRARWIWLLVALLAVAAIVLFLIRPGWAYGWDWTGFGASRSPIRSPMAPYDYYPSKSLWDWLQLLVIPLAVVGVGYALNRAQQRRELARAEKNRQQDLEIANKNRQQDLEIANKNRQQDLEIANKNRQQDQETARIREQELVLETYLSQMATLLLHEELSEPDPHTETAAQQVARVQTLTALRRLDGSRRRTVIEFLYDARLIGHIRLTADYQVEQKPAIISLRGADLSGVNLDRARLIGADLTGAKLDGASLRETVLDGVDLSESRLGMAVLTQANLDAADLSGAFLGGADLSGADLGKASLIAANLTEAKLGGADLTEAKLGGADLTEAKLDEADLTGAELDEADLTQANLDGATLRDAIVTYDQLNSTRRLGGVTLPDGTKLPDHFTGTLPLSKPSRTTAPPVAPTDAPPSPTDTHTP